METSKEQAHQLYAVITTEHGTGNSDHRIFSDRAQAERKLDLLVKVQSSSTTVSMSSFCEGDCVETASIIHASTWDWRARKPRWSVGGR